MSVDDALEQAARRRVGTTLKGKWHLDALLGMGGMASVYAATHRNRKRVAIKMLHAELSVHPEARERFLREGYAANTVGHPGAVAVDDEDVAEDGAAFLVMELLEGESLASRAERAGGRLPLGEVLRAAEQVLDVLAAAHGKKIVHRDLKPDNLFLTRTGEIKVLDFGIARVREVQSSASATQTGSLLGTPAFMAPEQARGRWKLVDGRTDLWSLGATMFTLLTGRRVHEAETVTEAIAAACTMHAASIGSVLPSLPQAVVSLIDRALLYDRDARWPDARSMQASVREALGRFGGSLELLPVSPAIPATSKVEAGPGSSTDLGFSRAPTFRRTRAPAAILIPAAAVAIVVVGIVLAYAALPYHAAPAPQADQATPAVSPSVTRDPNALAPATSSTEPPQSGATAGASISQPPPAATPALPKPPAPPSAQQPQKKRRDLGF